MNYYLFFLALFLHNLLSSLNAQAQKRYQYEIKVNESQPAKPISFQVDTLEVDLMLTGIDSTKPVEITIKEIIGSSHPTENLPVRLFGVSAKPQHSDPSSLTQAVRISLTATSYGVGTVDEPQNNENDKKASYDSHPWALPVSVTIDYDYKTFTLQFYKSFKPTGSVLFDATRLDSLRQANDPSLYTLINFYDDGAKTKNSKAELQAYFDDMVSVNLEASAPSGKKLDSTVQVPRNPYLANLIKKLPVTFPEPGSIKFTAIPAIGANGQDRGASPLGALSNPILAADALATFIARRFKQEINVAFLNEFRKKLTIDSTLGIVFPQTKEILLAIDPYEYTTFLESMKKAFEEDLAQLPGHSATLLDSLVAQKKIILNRDRVALSRVTLLTVQRTLNGGKDYWGALRSIKTADVAGGSDLLKSVMLTGSLLTNSGLDINNRVRLPSLTALAKKDFLDFALGLLLARYDTLIQPVQTSFSADTSLVPTRFLTYALHTKTGDYSTFKTGATQLAQSLLSFDAALETLRKSKAKADNPAANSVTATTDVSQRTLISYTDFALKLTTILDQMLDIRKVFPAVPALRIIPRILKPVRDGILAFKHVQEKSYPLAVIYTANMLIALTSQNDSTDSRTTAALKKYGTFMTSVVAAETRDQMLEALETAALPVGSYRIKRNNFFSVAINTYGGVAVGREYIREISSVTSTTGVSKAGGWLLAPYAPVGVSMAWGRNADYVNHQDHGSFGIHVNLLDVGALAAVRLSNETASLPEFEWKNLLAPGIQAMWGLPKSVWTIAAGIQLGPELRKVNLDQGTTSIDTKQWRIGLTFSADIPLFNVFTQANNRRIKTIQNSSLHIKAGKP